MIIPISHRCHCHFWHLSSPSPVWCKTENTWAAVK